MVQELIEELEDIQEVYEIESYDESYSKGFIDGIDEAINLIKLRGDYY